MPFVVLGFVGVVGVPLTDCVTATCLVTPSAFTVMMAERSAGAPLAVRVTCPLPTPLSVESASHDTVVLTFHVVLEEMFSIATPLASR